MIYRSLFIALLFFIGLQPSAEAAHLVGGEISYQCLGNNNYRISLSIYRDCNSNGAPFDSLAVITIFDAGSGQQVNNLLVVPYNVYRLPVVAPNNCTSLPNNVCTEKATYRATVNLPPNANGYSLVHQRCCRNATISNLPNPEDWGNTYTIDIPPSSISCNSSPSFSSDPPVVLCLNQKIQLDLSASEPDGDSLFYSLCEPLHGGGRDQASAPGPNSPRPNPAAAPPFVRVPFLPGFSGSYPLPSANPAFAIDPNTGILIGRPTQQGQFVFAVCVEEYRNGQLISTLRRDFQFNVSGSCQAIISQIEDPAIGNDLCVDRNFTFQENCINATTYYWDLGDPTTTLDVSNQPSVSYTYPDTGRYTVMLVANPGSPCADTSFYPLRVRDGLMANFELAGDYCFATHAISLTPSGNYSSDAQFEWDFDGPTLSGNANEEFPGVLRYAQQGSYRISLKVTDGPCEIIVRDSINVFPAPILKNFVPNLSICAGESIRCIDSSETFGPVRHRWYFGDGTVSQEASPEHRYMQAGIYSIRHELYAHKGCRDTLVDNWVDHIEVFPTPFADLSVQPTEVDISDALVFLSDTSSKPSLTYIPGRPVIRDLDEESVVLGDTGLFQIVHITFNEFGCTDTVFAFVRVSAPLEFYIPNAFTPNNDGTNEGFKVVVNGVAQFHLQIFDRWGKRVFESFDQQHIWNGRVNNSGQPVPLGYYTYRIEVIDQKERKRHKRIGSIALLR